MKINNQILRLFVATGLAVVAASAQAGIMIGDSLTVTSTGLTGVGGYVSYNGGSWLRTTAGAFSLNVVDTTQAGATLQIQSFCTDVGVAWKNTDVYTAKTFSDAGTGVYPAWSAGESSIQAAAYLYNTYFVGQTLTAAQDASLQLAIWKVLYDSSVGGLVADTSFGAGKLQAFGFTGTIVADAAVLVQNVNTAITSGKFVTYTGVWLSPDDGKSQGLIYSPGTPVNSNVPATSVPEPTTIVAGALMLLPFGVSAFKIIRRKQVALI